MTQKITIEQEIENIKTELNTSEDTDPDYIGPELKEIQNYVLARHASAEKDMDTLILLQIKEKVGQLEKKVWYSLLEKLRPLLESLSYRAKLDIVEIHYLSKDDSSKLVKPLQKLNSLRIEFAHHKGMELRNKYSYQTNKGKQNIRDLFRALKKANDELNNYFF